MAIASARRHAPILFAVLALSLLAIGRVTQPAAAYIPWAAAGAMLAALALIHRRDHAQRRIARAALFDDCRRLFESCDLSQDGVGYPVLRGRYLGHQIRLEPVVDTVAWRKLPSLWLKATLVAPTTADGVLDLIARPQGVEFYSPSGDLPVRLRTPPAWPADLVVCADEPGAARWLDELATHVVLFEDPQMKELLVTPGGVRLVRQVWQAERAEYLVLRQVKFAEVRVDPAVVDAMLRALTALWDTFAPTPPLAQAS
jgi:hypothetical protein